MDPLTLIVTALALGAAAGLQTTAAQAVKDAYNSLKTILQQKYAHITVAQLEQAPDSQLQKAAVAEMLAKTEAAQDIDLLSQAQTVLRVVQEKAPEAVAAINISLNEVVTGASLNVADIVATGDITIAMQKVKANHDINITGLGAGRTTEADNLGESPLKTGNTDPKV